MSRLARAILARLDGVFDDPDLLSFGALSDTDMDIRRFCAETIAADEGDLDKGDPAAIRLAVFYDTPPGGGAMAGYYYAPEDRDDGPRLSGDVEDEPVFGPFPSRQAAEQAARDKEGVERIFFITAGAKPGWMP